MSTIFNLWPTSSRPNDLKKYRDYVTLSWFVLKRSRAIHTQMYGNLAMPPIDYADHATPLSIKQIRPRLYRL